MPIVLLPAVSVKQQNVKIFFVKKCKKNLQVKKKGVPLQSDSKKLV